MNRNILQRKIASRVRWLRKKNKLTQVDLAAKARINRPTLTELETGKFMPSVFIMMKIAKALRMSVDEVICG